MISIIIAIAASIAFSFYGFSIAPLMAKIPKKHLGVPSWLIYFLLFPAVNLIIAIIVLMFSFPKAIDRCMPDIKEARSSATIMRWVGFGICVDWAFITSKWFTQIANSEKMGDMWLTIKSYEILLASPLLIILLLLYSKYAKRAVSLIQSNK